MIQIDINFDVYSDTPSGKDPDSFSSTLRNYHKFLWSKRLPNKEEFYLNLDTPKLLHHKSALGEFFLSSDSIGHTYSRVKKMSHIIEQIGDEEINEVVDTLRSGWITSGPKTKVFESNFSDFIGGNVAAIAVNSATSGLHLALEALGVGEGDEVIVPVLTFTATAEVVRYVGADVKFVDIDPFL